VTKRLSQDQFEELAERVRVWGRPGVSDAAPVVDRITPDVTRAALYEVQSGRSVSLGRPWSVDADVDNQHPALHYMTNLGATLAHGDTEPTGYMDFIAADYHGKTVSHIDAFSHIAYRDQIFGGHSASESLSRRGMQRGDVNVYGPLVTRGVLLDMTAGGGVDWVEPGTAWSLDEVQSTLDREGVVLRSGDALLLHSGHDRRRRELGAWDPDAEGAGLHVSAVPWLIDAGVSIFGADGETDVRPSPVEGVTLPIHVLALTMAGAALLDNLALETLAHACREQNRYEFALVVSPLNIPGGTGSPINPLAIF
jgi:kynurenine formamidase